VSASLAGMLPQMFLVATRIAGLMTFAPFFGSLSVPVRVKIGLTAALTLVLYPVCAAQAAALPAAMTLGEWFQRELGEVMLGMLFGWGLQFVFEGMELAGQLMSFQFGFSLVNVIDPQSQVETTVLSTFQELFAALIFLQFGVHRSVLRGLARSFELVPAGMAHLSLGSTEGLLHAATAMWVIGVQIALPVMVATLFTDIALGFLGRATPQFPVLFLGISVKSLLGFAVLAGIVAAWPRVLEQHFLHALAAAEDLLRLLR
jgi:flagellar biosynthetic protein FliR